jgi:hypothetical protein
MRVVRVQDVGLQPLDDSRQPPCRGQVDLVSRPQRDEVHSLRHPLDQFAVGMSDERSAVAECAQAHHGVFHLTLPAAPFPGCIDV